MIDLFVDDLHNVDVATGLHEFLCTILDHCVEELDS